MIHNYNMLYFLIGPLRYLAAILQNTTSASSFRLEVRPHHPTGINPSRQCSEF